MSTIVETRLQGFTMRFAKEADAPLILHFIKSLAEYEHLSEFVTATEEDIKNAIFVRRFAEVIIGEYEGEPIGFMLFFHNYSTFTGKPGIYLEDLFVIPTMRSRGIGSIMFAYLAKLAKERGCTRFEWACLDWNAPSLGFYKKLGAKQMDQWIIHRLDGDSLDELAGQHAQNQ